MLFSQLNLSWKVHLIVTIAVVALRLKSYDLLSELAPKGLEIGTVVHVLRMHVSGAGMTRLVELP